MNNDQKTVEILAEKVLSKVRDGIKEQIGDALYKELSNYLDEHFQNARARDEEKLIAEIAEKYIKDPKSYKFAELRKKIFQENKDVIVKTLTDEAIKDSVENVIMEYTHRDYHFNWQWKDGIVKVILKNWNQFKDDERIKEAFGRELDNRQSYIENLEKRLEEIKEI